MENKKFRALLLLLHENLEDSDIPHHHFLCAQIMSNWEQHINLLREEMGMSLACILHMSFLLF